MGRQCVVMFESRICFYVIHCVHWLHEHTALHNIMLTLHRLGIALQCHVTVTEALVSCASHARHIDITTRA
jgi:hypothetical protein